MRKKWEFYNTNQEKVKQIAEKNNINKLLATILVNRNIVEDEQINVFLNPTRKNFHNPLLMPDMEIALNRVLKAIENNEKVIIYGDYDVDGITSTTVLKSFLADRGLYVDSYIPNRLDEGYGLNNEAIDKIAQEGYTLMITVDCGISANKEIDYANTLGIETIVTDHHEPGEILPNAIAVVDAKRKDNKYPCRDLAGVGVVFKLIQAIGQKLNLDEKEYLKYLDIVCVGTISDIVPLVDENRVIAKLGLLLVSQTRNMGLKSILISSGYKNVDSNTISFGVAPRINASGRMGHQEQALQLFLSTDVNEVKELTAKLNGYNTKRQEIEKDIFNEAKKKIEKENLAENSVIVVAGNGWHHGVIGIVASKITENYFRPTILLSFDDDLGKGSGRSIPGFDLHNALTKCDDSLYKFGGHAMAVGVTVEKDKYELFKQELQQIAEENHIQDIVPIIKIDAELNLSEVTREWVESLQKLEPFGEGNKMPLFAFRNLKIDSIRALSEGKHLKLTLQDNNVIINAIGFNMGELTNEYRIGDKIDVVGILEINSFNGVDNIQINLKDVMKSL
ncbi:MAG: single-stranded-DNA-specific exonuclease RecJ [Clostridia bacterium]|nr:single-stranded-DNA-specific exonuclease RecJ [Clostridia bacterium]